MHNHLNSLAALITVLFSLAVPMAMADSAWLIIDAQKQFQYAQQLFEEGQFQRAAEEYDRFLFFFPDAPNREAALFKAGEALLRAGDGMAALQRFGTLIQSGVQTPLLENAYFMAAESYLLLSNPDQAVSLLNTLIGRTDRTTVKDRAHVRIAWIHIEQMDWTKAKDILARVSPAGSRDLQVEALESELDRADHLPEKNPKLAGALSIFPGAGQMYTGRYQDGLAALVVNGGLFWAAYESFDNDLNALGGLISIVGLGFYTANIYGAVSSAHKYNQAQKQGFVEQLRQHLVIGAGPLQSAGRSSSNAFLIQWHGTF